MTTEQTEEENYSPEELHVAIVKALMNALSAEQVDASMVNAAVGYLKLIDKKDPPAKDKNKQLTSFVERFEAGALFKPSA